MTSVAKWLTVRVLVVALAVIPVFGSSPTASAQVVVATVPVGDGPHGVAVNPDTNLVYVANTTDSTMSVIDGVTNLEIDVDGDPSNGITRISLPSQPFGVGVNPETDRIYVSRHFNVVDVIDGSTNMVLSTILVGFNPAGVAVNPLTNLIYVANASGSVSVIDGATDTEIDVDGDPSNGITRIPVGVGANMVAVNPLTNRIYVSVINTDSVAVIDGVINGVIATVPVGDRPEGIAVNPNTNLVYVANALDSTVSVIDGVINAEIDVDGDPSNGLTRIFVDRVFLVGVGVNPGTNRIYVASDSGVSVIDGATNSVSVHVVSAFGTWGVAVGAVTSRVYVANRVEDNLTVIADPPLPSETIELAYDDGGAETNFSLRSGQLLRMHFLVSDFGLAGPHQVAAVQISFSNVRGGLGRLSFDMVLRDASTDATAVASFLPAVAHPDASPNSVFETYNVLPLNFVSENFFVELRPIPPPFPSGSAAVDFDESVSPGRSQFSSDGVTWRDFADFFVGNLLIRALVIPTTLPVDIDIKPGSDPNSFSARNRGFIPVAILSRADFDAPSEVDKTSLTFGRTGDEESLAFCPRSPEDVNGDGLLDQVCFFTTQLTGFQVGDTEGILRGQTVDGVPIEGRDAVRVRR